mmetsp:Transcript_653/g.1160  ORF Transcript_653/g.1160 Transcript_653/m.1160 type:complete len:280 (-) Transcript_653:152-991(-)
MNMAASKLTQDERLRRKREAAKLRQRRCRAKKKREAELQNLRKSKSKSIVSPYKKSDSVQFIKLPNRAVFKPLTQMDLSGGGTNTGPDVTKDLLALTPCSSSHSPPPTLNLVTPQGSTSLPSMPPLSSCTKFEEERANSTCTPPSQIDEHELTAIDAILSLRRSPVTEAEEQILPSFPQVFDAGTKLIHSTGCRGGSLDYMHGHNVPLPFLPEIKSHGTAVKLPFPVGCKNVASRSLSFYPCENYGTSKYSTSRSERGDLLIQNRCSLPPGVYFYHNGV